MRNYFLIALLFGSLACTKTPSYDVKVKLTAADGKAFLYRRAYGEWVKMDSSEFKSGECQFKGSVKNPEVYYLNLSSQKKRLPFFLENSMISIEGSADSIDKAKISGSMTQDEYRKLQDKLDSMDKQAMVFYNQYMELAKAGEMVKSDSIKKLANDASEKIDQEQKSYIKANPASFVSPFILSQIYYEMEADVLDGYLSGLDPKLDSILIISILKDRVAKLKTVAVGQTAPDFTMNDANGNPIKLSDVYSKNEYTLIDFWASWCGPCRGENPNVVATYNSYKTKGFGVFGVSLDQDKDKWMKAVADDQLTWLHVSDLKGWKNEAAALYAVNSIPANLLVDKSGKIIARNIREEKLPETIAGLLK